MQLSPATQPATAKAPHGSQLATSFGNPLSVPEHISKRLRLSSDSYDRCDLDRTLSLAKHEGWLTVIPRLADDAFAALAPVEHSALIDRLTLLGMSMANGRDSDQIRAWLHETARLLSDLPQSVLFNAIDDCVREPGRVFAPSVGEIRERASKELTRAERQAARLRRLADLIASGADISEWREPPAYGFGAPPKEPEPNVTPEEAAAILAEFGLPSTMGTKLAGMLKPDETPTRQQMIAVGKEPAPITPRERDSWEFMA